MSCYLYFLLLPLGGVHSILLLPLVADICMRVVNTQFELLEFVFHSVCVDLLYVESSLTFTTGSVSLWCVCIHVVVFGLPVRLSWYPMWMRWFLQL